LAARSYEMVVDAEHHAILNRTARRRRNDPGTTPLARGSRAWPESCWVQTGLALRTQFGG
jgi:hypothetical protein